MKKIFFSILAFVFSLAMFTSCSLGQEKLTSYTIFTDAKDINNIKVLLKDADIDIEYSEDENIAMKYFPVDNGNFINMDASSRGEIEFIEEENSEEQGILRKNKKIKKVILYIPKSYKNSIHINTGEGVINTNIDGKLFSIYLYTLYGDINMENTRSRGLIASTLEGNITIKDAECQDMRLSSSRGKISADKVSLTQQGRFYTTLGEINLELLEVGRETVIESIEGKINVSLSNEEDLNIILNLKTNEKDEVGIYESIKESKDSDRTLTMTTVDGEIIYNEKVINK